jgi:hypothetical protein
VTDANAVWLADWYLANLNALFCAPVDYALWQALDQRSPIASRLYEFLLLNFHGPAPVLQIGYAYLATLLPVHAERFPSDARRQMEPALNLLAGAGLPAQRRPAGARPADRRPRVPAHDQALRPDRRRNQPRRDREDRHLETRSRRAARPGVWAHKTSGRCFGVSDRS